MQNSKDRSRSRNAGGMRARLMYASASSLLAIMTGAAIASSQTPIATAPIQLCTAKTAFLGVGGAPTAVNNETFTTQSVYVSLYRAFQAAGRYTLVSSPSAAELSMEVSIVDNQESNVPPGIVLGIRDTRTHALLWTIVEPVRFSARDKVFSKNVDIATAQIIAELDALSSSRQDGVSCHP